MAGLLRFENTQRNTEMADIVTKDQLMKLSLDELDSLSNLVADARKEKAILLREDAKSKILDFARQTGLSIQDLFGFGDADEKTKRPYVKKADGGEKAPRKPSVAKYKHPENPEITYSGQGRRPQWFVDYIASGRKAEDLLIKK